MEGNATGGPWPEDNIWPRRSCAGGATDLLKVTPLHEEPLLQSKASGDPGY